MWQTALDLEPSVISDLRRTLSVLETDRAYRYRFREDQDRFIVAHGVLRRILGAYLCAEPSALRFEVSPLGKPRLAPEFERSGLSFSMSHSGGQALYAVCRGSQVGIDLEFVRPELDWERIAGAFFHPNDMEFLFSRPVHDRSQEFFRLWTRKEAWAKADGQAVSAVLGSWVPPDQEGTQRLLDGVEVVDVGVIPGYAAALAVIRNRGTESLRG